MTGDRLGVGFIGAGFITREFHAPTFHRIRDADITGIMNPTESKAESMAESCPSVATGDPIATDSVRDLVQHRAVDAVWVTSPNHTRVGTVEAIVEEVEQGGADLEGVAIEKPLARTVEEAREIVETIEGTSMNHAYLENLVYMPAVMRMKERLWESAQAVGRPYLARSTGEHSGPHSAWFWDGTKQGGGVLTDLMSHYLVVNRYLLSTPGDSDLDPVAVTCDMSTLKWNREDYAEDLAEEYDVDYHESPSEDYASATVYYETPTGELIMGEATTSWCFVGSGIRITVELLGPEYSGSVNTLDSGTEVYISDAAVDESANSDDDGPTVGGSMPLVPQEVSTYGYLDQNEHVVDAFRAERNAREDLRDGLQIAELIAAAYMSAEQGERIRLHDVDVESYVPAPGRGEFGGGPPDLQR